MRRIGIDKDRDRLTTRCHDDGSLTYWSVMRQRWIKRGWAIDRADLAALSQDEREQVLCHIERHRWIEIAGGTYAAPPDLGD